MNYNDSPDMRNQQRDIILSPNEYIFVQSNTNGIIKTYAGPITITISAQDSVVKFDSNSKRFIPTSNINEAKSLFVSPPENWYAILKNPAPNNQYPESGKANMSPELRVGEKVNVRGPVSFALYPGQMAKVVRGHALRTNQYLLARVYEAVSANSNRGEMLDAEGNRIEDKTTYINGQILVIKGTDVSFYIPPTGIEVIPCQNKTTNGYIRDAVTLERLEYCILKDEDGNKRYVHGPKVVFPEPTEAFVTSPKGGYIFRAIELSPISGIYVKVIAEYKEKKGDQEITHPVGEELFITGNDQMIYYPRPEHAVISYDNKMMHHAIAIPKGEGRYVMNRLTGEIATVRGPVMYLPDPRTEVIVKRKLTPKQCSLWFPGNTEAANYNAQLSERAVEKSLKSMDLDMVTAYCSLSDSATMANLEAKSNISRGTSYTKPRTITLDNKYDGVVSMDIWTGYAVDVVSKDGTRKVVCGPQTILLDYDQTLEEMQLSTGNPKTTDKLLNTVYLRHENNKVSDMINVETKDFVNAVVKVSYCVNFLPEYKDKWFNVENYVKYLSDRLRSLVKREAKKYSIEEFYQDYADIVRNVVLDIHTETEDCDCGDNCKCKSKPAGRFFSENGMIVHDCEVLSLRVQADVEEILEEHQMSMVKRSLELRDAETRVRVSEALAVAEKKEHELANEALLHKMELQRKEAMNKLEIQSEINRQKDAETMASKQAEKDMQIVLDAIAEAGIAREAKSTEAKLNKMRAEANIEKAKQEAYAEMVVKIMSAIQPDLVAAMESNANADLTAAIAKSLAPYAMAGGDETASDVINKVLRGTSLEDFVEKFTR